MVTTGTGKINLKYLRAAGSSARKLRELATGYSKNIYTGSAENVPAYRRCNDIVRFVKNASSIWLQNDVSDKHRPVGPRS
jgi:hypothetical protein